MSSQFISSILMAAPYADEDVELTLPAPPASRSYLDVTVDVMLRFGARLERRGYDWFRVKSGAAYRGRNYRIEGDYSSASYLFAVAAVCGGRVTVTGLSPTSVQGDRRFFTALEAMGCHVTTGADVVAVERAGDLSGIDIDMSSSPIPSRRSQRGGDGIIADDDSGSRICGKSDRASDCRDPPEDGSEVQVAENSFTITPAPLHGVLVDLRDDHRTAMALRCSGSRSVA